MGPHVIVSGYGRSGTNMVLDMFDFHARTHCRNESNVTGTALDGLAGFFAEEASEGFVAGWTAGLDRMARSVGRRDRLPAKGKVFLRRGAVARLAGWAQSKSRLRRLAGLYHDWPCSPLIYDRAAMAREALPVFKMILCGPIATAHPQDPGQKLVHVMRRPAEFLGSWYNRYVLRGRGPEAVFADTMERLPRILAMYDADPGRFASYSRAALLESELWLWRYTNDRLYALNGSDRYMPVIYAEAKAQPLATAEALYRFAGLEFDEACAARVRGMENRLFAAPHRESLPADEVVRAVDRVLQGSTLPV